MAPDTPLAALSPEGYRIPAAVISRRRTTLLMSVSLAALFGWLAYRAAQDAGALLGHDHEALLWTALMLVASHQTVLAWFDKPYTVAEGQAAALRLEPVCVSIPVWNESPEIVDRVLFALACQTWPAGRIVVVDDGSTRFDYTPLAEFWVARFAELGIECEWHRQANKGKRHAQAVAFRSVSTGRMVTLDSDTVLAGNALEEIAKPFADPHVWSVAGLELAYNQTKNLLTRINGMRQLSWQLVQCAALNRFGAILVNRGTFAAYRAELTYQTTDAYLGERFLGKQVAYSDDSLLTLYALGRGRAVQQVSAHQYSEYAETISHALRQWTRWMRGATIRSIWRAKYLPLTSYAGLINYLNWWQLAASSSAYVYVGIVLPYEGHASLSALSAAVGASYLANVRTLLIRRDDQDGLSQLDTWLLSPLAWAWSLLVLRPIRAYAILTCANNGWGTRSKVEVGQHAGREGAGVPARIGAGETTAALPVAGRAPAAAAGHALPETAELPAVGPRHRRRPLLPVTVLAGAVALSAAGVVCAGLLFSLDTNVVAPPAPAPGVRAGSGAAPASRVSVPPVAPHSRGPSAPVLVPAAHRAPLPTPSPSPPASPSGSGSPSALAGPSASSSSPAAPSPLPSSPTPEPSGPDTSPSPTGSGSPSATADATPTGSAS